MLTTNKLILSLVIVMVIMTVLMLFKLPNYRIPGYITLITLFILTSMFVLKSSTSYKFSIIHILLVLLPLISAVIINVNKKFDKILDEKNTGVTALNSLQTLSILFSVTQLILFYNSIDNHSWNFIYGSGIITALNLLLNGLLWREVAFYITDG